MGIAANFSAVWQKTTLMQRAMLFAVVLACCISGALLTKWARTPSMRLLYQQLSPEEAAKICEKVTEKGIAYELRGGGTSIYVPEENVYQLRLDMAKDGLPVGEQGGYKIFDDEKIGISPFVQSVNLNRALQDELAKTIQMIDGVVYARVHLVRPEQTLFGAQGEKTTASVVVKTRSGIALSQTNIAAITHMVAGSVEGLKSENVIVVDSSGRLLSRKSDDGGTASAAGTVLEYKEQVEQTLARKAQDMLAEVLGPGRATVSVAAVVNMNSLNLTKETYDPSTKVVIKEETTNKSEVGPSTGEQGKTPAASGSQTKDETMTNEYVIGKTVEQKVNLPGEIMSLSVSAVVDLSPPATADANKPAAASMTIADVEEIIRNAVGLKTGDAIKVVNAKFHQASVATNIDQDYQQAQKWQRYTELARQASLGILAISALVILKMLGGARKRALDAMPAASLAGGGAPAGLLAGAESSEPFALRNQISSALQKNPDDVKKLFANWAQSKDE